MDLISIKDLSKLQIYTSAGVCKLEAFEEFLYSVSRQQVYSNNSEITVARHSRLQPGIANSSKIPLDCNLKKDVLKTKPFYNYLHENSRLSENSVEDYIMEFLKKEFIQLLAKKQPSLNLSKGVLDVQAVQNMADLYALEFGGEPMLGFEINLNEYQRFFVIACPKDFVFYYSDFKEKHEFRGVLHTAYEHRWILVPFKEITLKEQALYL